MTVNMQLAQDADGYITASGGFAEGDRLKNIETIIGTHLDDTIFGGDADNVIEARAGADRIDGGLGRDTAYYAHSEEAVTIDLSIKDDAGITIASGGDAAGDQLSDIENLTGTVHEDVLTGDDGDNILEGGGGADILDGGDGSDTASYSGSASRIIADLSHIDGHICGLVMRKGTCCPISKI